MAIVIDLRSKQPVFNPTINGIPLTEFIRPLFGIMRDLSERVPDNVDYLEVKNKFGWIEIHFYDKE